MELKRLLKINMTSSQRIGAKFGKHAKSQSTTVAKIYDIVNKRVPGKNIV